jgi:hypothetical protein
MPMSDQAMLAVHSPALGWVTLIVSWSAEGVTVSDVPSPSSSGWLLSALALESAGSAPDGALDGAASY